MSREDIPINIFFFIQKNIKRNLMHKIFKVKTFRGYKIAQMFHKVASYKFKYFSFNAGRRKRDENSDYNKDHRLFLVCQIFNMTTKVEVI